MMHLAELLEEEMQERGWTMTDLVMNMGPHEDEEAWQICFLSWELFVAIRHPSVLLGDVMAQQLSNAFDITPKFFANLHEAWRQAQVKPRESENGTMSEAQEGAKMIDWTQDGKATSTPVEAEDGFEAVVRQLARISRLLSTAPVEGVHLPAKVIRLTAMDERQINAALAHASKQTGGGN